MRVGPTGPLRFRLTEGENTTLYCGLRDWLAQGDEMGELRKLEGIALSLEMGAAVDVL